jgi:two-component system, NarL family, response regulator DevR
MDADDVGPAVPRKIRVFLLDDHALVRRGVQFVLDADGGFEVVGEAETAGQARRRIPILKPDVAILNLRLPDGDGVSLTRELTALLPDQKVLILTSLDDDSALLAAAAAGAKGYLLKRIRGPQLLTAIREVAAGRSLISPADQQHANERIRARAQSSGVDADGLSGREKQVLELIGDGLSNKEIAEQLKLADKTVRNHVASLFAKLGVHRRSEVAILATELRHQRTGWPDIPPWP